MLFNNVLRNDENIRYYIIKNGRFIASNDTEANEPSLLYLGDKLYDVSSR